MPVVNKGLSSTLVPIGGGEGWAAEDSMRGWLPVPAAPGVSLPTAIQIDVHETPLRALLVVLEFGLETTDHAVPFHCSTRVSPTVPLPVWPTAVQAVADVHETPAKLERMFGVATIDQDVPFHCSTRVDTLLDVLAPPTAVQFEAEVHETPERLYVVPVDGLGLGTTDQVVPFHCSIRDPPTAMQAEAEVHDTPSRPPELGLGTTDQVVPFHCSIRDDTEKGAVCMVELPTAVQAVADEHETATSLELPTLGLGTIDHVDPFHCSMRVEVTTLNSYEPTAVQDVAEVHETPERVLL
jgi:hypothetical protein